LDENAYRSLFRKFEGMGPLGRTRNGWRIILKRILKKYDGRMWSGLV
jgi:hypothetical protein